MHDLTVALIYGGRSVEHVVSCRSGASVGRQLQEAGYRVIPIAISREGRWSVQSCDFPKDNSPLPSSFRPAHEVSILPGLGLAYAGKSLRPDTCFPVTHGTGGEDGMLQGLLELAGVPYVGSNPAASSAGMHKHTAKLIASDAQVPVLPSLLLDRHQGVQSSLPTLRDRIARTLGDAVIVKPEDGGSSVGVTAINSLTEQSLSTALGHAFAFTDTVLLEPLLTDFLELECAVIASEQDFLASMPGQVIDPLGSANTFLTYGQKYLSPTCAYIHVPAPLDPKILGRISEQASVVARKIGVKGYARVDFLYDRSSGSWWFNEINTLPGMTGRSHFPVLAASMGYGWQRFLDTVIEESLSRFKATGRLQFDFPE